MTQIAPVLGVLAALVGIANTVPCVRDTVRRSTRPHRGTWLICLANGALALLIGHRRAVRSPPRSLVAA